MTKNKAIIFSVILLAGAAGLSRAADVSTHALGSKLRLPDTGQTSCYDAAGGVIGCPAPQSALAQDGSYNKTATSPSYLSYVLGGSDAVTVDNRTGLMWAKDGNLLGCNNGGTLNWESALSYCEALTFATYSDWRLPNVRELMSIVDFDLVLGPFINVTFFPGTAANGYWTATTYVPAALNAYAVFFNTGASVVGTSPKSGTGGNVRCVRGGP